MSLACLSNGSCVKYDNKKFQWNVQFKQKHRIFQSFQLGPKQPQNKHTRHVLTRILIDDDQASSSFVEDFASQYQQMCQRLAQLIQLRKIYQQIIRAEYILLVSPQPLYQKRNNSNEEFSSDSNIGSTVKIRISADKDDLDQQLLRNSIEVLSEMQLVCEQLQSEYRSISNQVNGLFQKGEREVNIVKGRMQQTELQLQERIKLEIDNLPYQSLEEAQKWLQEGGESEGTEQKDQNVENNPLLQIEKVERSAEKFVARKLQPAVQKVRESQDMMDIFRDSAIYLKDLWFRLNGGGGRQSSSNNFFAFDPLPQPQCSKSQIQEMISRLEIESDDLERRLQEANSAREQKLRSSGISERTQLAFVLRELDMEVMQVSRQLALKSLQIMLQNIYLSLEEEIVEFDNKELAKQPVQNTYSDEVALYIAEFALLSEQISNLAPALNSTSGLILSQTDDQLEKLIQDINDMRNRLGISDRVVYGGSQLSLRKAVLKIQLSTLQSVNKIKQGSTFLVRGASLLGADLGYAGGLFSKAAFGSNLKPREVMALRRTFFDLLLFFPFIVILIVPITPVGHVLVFGFIQRFFPNLFPSQFSNRRQQIMVKYDQLRQQLEKADEKSPQNQNQQGEEDVSTDSMSSSDSKEINQQDQTNAIFGVDTVKLPNLLQRTGQDFNSSSSSSSSKVSIQTMKNTEFPEQ